MAERAIVLIGFMGAGKSSAVRAVAAERGGAIDLDTEIEKKTGGRSVRAYFDEVGEESFRALERAVAAEVLGASAGAVVALGGGTPMQPDVQALLADHTVVLLEVKAADAWARVSRSDRPLVQRGEEAFKRLFEERLSTYEELADVVIPDAKPKAVADAIGSIRQLAQLPVGTKMIWAQSGQKGYPIFVGRGLLGAGWWPLEGRRFCVSDSVVGDLLAAHLGSLATDTVLIPAGEESKNLREVERVMEALARAGMTREDHVVALGGGVVGDLAGFCAASYQRGVPVVQVPTTLVAQVDSSIGGKTGVDLKEGKNYAGAYHQPAAVIADVGTLESLPKEELGAGFVEVLKTGLLAGGSLWERVRLVEDLNPYELSELVFACARYKSEVVAADERDAGLRNALNLGHTVGHAIEVASDYRAYRHGEAVGIGLLAALRLSGAAELRDEVEAMLTRFDLPTRVETSRWPDASTEAILAAVQRDKKRTAEGVGFVLLSVPGEPQVGQLVDPDEVRAAVEELLA